MTVVKTKKKDWMSIIGQYVGLNDIAHELARQKVDTDDLRELEVYLRGKASELLEGKYDPTLDYRYAAGSLRNDLQDREDRLHGDDLADDEEAFPDDDDDDDDDWDWSDGEYDAE